MNIPTSYATTLAAEHATTLAAEYAAAEAGLSGGAWQVAMGTGALVLLAGGITAVVRREMRPGQALGVAGLALAVSALALLVSLLAGRSAVTGGAYTFLVVATTTIGGMALAVAVVSARPRRR
jgi:hypothetical protein